jgi:hypothetical protein
LFYSNWVENQAPKATAGKPEDFFHIFVNQPDYLALFLERVVATRPGEASSMVYNTLLELYLTPVRPLF